VSVAASGGHFDQVSRRLLGVIGLDEAKLDVGRVLVRRWLQRAPTSLWELSKDRQEHPLLVGVLVAAKYLYLQVIRMRAAWHVNQQIVAALEQEEVGRVGDGSDPPHLRVFNGHNIKQP
jgi:hypothetical protein